MSVDPSTLAPARRIWNLTWPMIASNALDLAVSLIELRLVRPFGPAATAALGVNRNVILLVEALALAVTSGVITLVSQSVGGRGRRQPAADLPESHFDLDDLVRHSVALVLLLGIPMALLGSFLSGPLLEALQVSEATRTYGEPYLRVYFISLIFSWGYLVGTALFRGAGNVQTPLKIALGVSVLQVGLDYFLIQGYGPVPALELEGAAWGALLARALGLVVSLGLLCRGAGPLCLHRPVAGGRILDGRIMKYLFRVGTPMALANVLRHGSRVLYLAVAGASVLHEALQAALGVALQLRHLGLIVALAFQTATATLVGQAIGRKDYPHAEEVARRSVQLLSLVIGILSVVLLAFADPIVALFISDPDVAALGAKAVRWFTLAQVFSNLSIGIQGALMGAGDTLPAMRYTFVGEWCLMLPVSYLLVSLDWVPDGLLASWVLAPMLTLFLLQRRFRSGRWQPSKILD